MTHGQPEEAERVVREIEARIEHATGGLLVTCDADNQNDPADLPRLLAALTSAFGGTGQPVPGEGSVRIWYLEDGFQTVVPAAESALYTGSELDRYTIPALAPSGQEESTRVDQGTQLTTALELAYCQPAVGAFFNFQLADDHDLGGWQSGLEIHWPGCCCC